MILELLIYPYDYDTQQKEKTNLTTTSIHKPQKKAKVWSDFKLFIDSVLHGRILWQHLKLRFCSKHMFIS